MSAKSVLLAQFDLHNKLFNNAVDQLSDDESNTIVAAPMNNIKWLAGHLLGCQTHFGRLAGVSVDFPWADHFPLGPGAPKADAPQSAFPDLHQIVSKWNEFHPILRNGLSQIPDEALEQKIESKHPLYQFNDSLGGLWAFINAHAAYTIGQIGILRRGLHKDPMKF